MVFSTNKTNRQDITELFFKIAFKHQGNNPRYFQVVFVQCFDFERTWWMLFQKHVGRTKYFPLKVRDSWMVEVVDILSQAEYHDVGSLSYIKLKWYCSFENRIRSFQNR